MINIVQGCKGFNGQGRCLVMRLEDVMSIQGLVVSGSLWGNIWLLELLKADIMFGLELIIIVIINEN